MNINTTPLLINPNNMVEKLSRVNFNNNALYDEQWLQTLIFDNVELLPIYEIDPDYSTLIPVCMELRSTSGRIDCLYVTTTGRLVIAEVKLYRNPQSRREVVGQTLDYAKDINKWSYAELDNQVKKRSEGISLYECVKAHCDSLSEAQFIDAVQKSLSMGRFLLLVVGDGIREGANEINDFLTKSANMEFTFAMIEMRIFELSDKSLLVQPAVLQKTDIVERHVISIDNQTTNTVTMAEDTSGIIEKTAFENSDAQTNNLTFWQSFLSNLSLDDKLQTIANPSKTGAISFSLPPSGATAWITVYKDEKSKSAGLFMRFSKNEKGQQIFNALVAAKDSIEEETSLFSWQLEERKIAITPTELGDLTDASNERLFAYYTQHLNELINTFRPILLRLAV